MFWALTVRRLAGRGASGRPDRVGSRPDLETGRRLLAVATEGGIVVVVNEPPPVPPRSAAEPRSAPRFRSTVGPRGTGAAPGSAA